MIADDPWGPMPSWAQRDTSLEKGDHKDDRASEDQEDDDNDFIDQDSQETERAKHVMILIDMNPQMFKPCMKIRSDPSSGNFTLISPLDATLLTAEQLFRLRVHRSSCKRDSVGVLLYGTRQKPAYSWKVTVPGGEAGETKETVGRKIYNQQFEMEDDEDEEEDEYNNNLDNYEIENSEQPITTTHTLLPLQAPAVEPILRLRQCLPTQRRLNCYFFGGPFVPAGERKRDLEKELVGNIDTMEQNDSTFYDSSISFITALKDAMNMFRAKSTPTHFQRSKDTKAIWIFTNDENPFTDNTMADKNYLFTLAKDIRDNGICIKLWALASQSHPFTFDRSLFFNEFMLGRDKKEIVSRQIKTGCFTDVDDMLGEINVVSDVPRKVQTLPLFLPDWWDNHTDDPCIMLDLFLLVQIKRKPSPVTVHHDTFKRTIKTTEILVEDTGELISTNRVQQYIPLGDYHLPITSNEVTGIKINANASGNNISLILIGFKPRESLTYKHIFDKALFGYPTDVEVKGSTKAFIGLFNSMWKKGVLAVCEYLPRRSACSRQVAMIPHEGDLYAPKGFLILPLPYREDMRKLPSQGGPNEECDLIAESTDLIKSQMLVDPVDYRKAFRNPTLKKFWSFIESIAFEIPLDERAADSEFNSELYRDVPSSVIESFRAALPDEESREKVAKNRSVKGKEVDLSEINWERVYAMDTWAKYKVNELKAYLRSIGGKVTGTKSVLIERIKEYMNDRGENIDD